MATGHIWVRPFLILSTGACCSSIRSPPYPPAPPAAPRPRRGCPPQALPPLLALAAGGGGRALLRLRLEALAQGVQELTLLGGDGAVPVSRVQVSGVLQKEGLIFVRRLFKLSFG